jgi:hypothetical protein
LLFTPENPEVFTPFDQRKGIFNYSDILAYTKKSLFQPELFELPPNADARKFLEKWNSKLTKESSSLAIKYALFNTVFIKVFNQTVKKFVKATSYVELFPVCIEQRKQLREILFTWKKGHEAGLAEDLAHFLKLFELCQPYNSSSLSSAPHYFLEPQRVQYDESEASEVIYPNLLDGGSLRVLKSSPSYENECTAIEDFYVDYIEFLDIHIFYLRNFTTAITRAIGILDSFPGPYPQLLGVSEVELPVEPG